GTHAQSQKKEHEENHTSSGRNVDRRGCGGDPDRAWARYRLRTARHPQRSPFRCLPAHLRKSACGPYPPRARRRLHGARRRTIHRQTSSIRCRSRTRLAQFRRSPAHRVRNERASARDHRANSGGGNRQGSWSFARDPRSGRNRVTSCRSFFLHRGAGRSLRQDCKAIHSMSRDRPGPPAIECAIDVWGRRGLVPAIARPALLARGKINIDKVRAAAKILGKAQRVLIVVGGGAQDASPEVTLLSSMLQAPVLGYRRGRGILDSRDPFSVTLPLGRDLWAEADAVLAVGTRLLNPMTQWGMDKTLQIVRVDADPDEPARIGKPKVALVGDAAPILRALIDELAKVNPRRAPRHDEMLGRQAKLRKRLAKLAPQLAFLEAIRAELPDDGIFVDQVTQIGFAARLALPVYRPRTFLSPGYQDNLGWGYATSLGAQHARPDVPVLSINGDGGFLYTGNELATAIRHGIPLVAIVYVDGAYGNARRIQQEDFGNRLIACDLANPDFVKYAESFGAAGRRARGPDELRKILRESFARREPTLIEVPIGAMPSPWEFILMPRVRGP